jgi:hypothetical protein
MERIIAFCGLACSECPAYLATQHDSAEERQQVAEAWSKQFSSDIKPEDICCDGCLPGCARHFQHCFECGIRACGVARGVDNCGFCDEYPCEKLERFFGFAPEAKARLDSIRAAL